MKYAKWSFWGLFWLLIFGFFHYTLPQNDIVRIVNTYEERQELGDWTRMFWARPDSQSAEIMNRDVQFIQGVTPAGDVIVYRNEDTGWSWPPYFKFDTANLYTEANDSISTKDAPEWVAVRHYGWRNEFLSVFPNAVRIRPVDSPDASFIPWMNIIILTLVAALFWAIRVRWIRFRERRIDPVLEDVSDGFADAGDSIAQSRGRLRGWIDRMRGK